MKNNYRINQQLKPGQYCLKDVFPDIRKYEVLKTIFDDAAEIACVIAQTKVFVVDHSYEMFVGNQDGSITIGLAHLRDCSGEILYLDIVHELCHVKQHLQGRNLYDRRKPYVDRETEIEAYRLTVEEARRIGLDDEAICDYLSVSWLTPEDLKRLACSLNITAGNQKK
jgi:hypothetical protein